VFGALHARAADQELLVELARSFTPRVEAQAQMPVLLDLRGLGRSWATPEALGAALLQKAHERLHDPHVALAWSRVAALTIARARPGLTIVPAGGEPAALAPLPLELLGLDEERALLFRRWGLKTLGDLASLPASGLAERLGKDGPRLARLARGEDDVPLVPTPPPERFELSLDLDWPVDGLEPLSFLLTRLLEPLMATLHQRGRRAAGLELALGLVDGSRHRRLVKPAAPSAEPRTWRTLLLLDLEAHPPADAVQTLRVRAEPTPARKVQFSLLDPAQPSPEQLAYVMARLHDWTAASRAGAATLLDTHRPGAFLLGSFEPGPLARERSSVRAGGGEPALAMRAFRPPLPAQVRIANGAPVFVSAGELQGAIVDRAGPWRVSGDWWDVAFSREEWDVELADGALYRLYQDLLRNAWFVDGELD
jgi:protein ImuB